MRIGQISNLTGLSKDTIRFYEKRGLISPKASESEWNNYKEYDNNLIEKLEFIKAAKSFGFTLNEIHDFCDLLEEEKPNCTFWEDKANLKIEELNKKIEELTIMRDNIISKVKLIKAQCNSSHKESCQEIQINTKS